MNDSQREAIHADGPTLVIAGPGTGKTYTIIQRVLYLIQEKKVKPEEILLVTYTVKATKELTTRLTNALTQAGIEVNLHDMYLGTFHQICRKILKEFREYSHLERNYLETDQFEQQYLVYGHFKEFEKIPGFTRVVPLGYMNGYGSHKFYTPWKRCQKICHYVNALSEELLDPEEMRRISGDKLDGRMEIMGRMMMKYDRLMREENVVDYTKLQTETYRLLVDNPKIRETLQHRIRYLMIDEYQDTDYIQEQLIRLLSRGGENIFVVGDDDQSIYRFRGATVGNILGFSERYEKCHTVKLDTNYRSSQGIINFCAQWMTKLNPHPWIWKKGEEGFYRYLKGQMKAGNPGVEPSVVRVTHPDYDTWLSRIVQLIEKLKKEQCITDYNQVAILWGSVKNYTAGDLQKALERKGIPVYAPRAGHFFERKEIGQMLGCLLWLFPCFLDHMDDFSEMQETPNMDMRYMEYVGMAHQLMYQPAMAPLKQWMEQTRSQIEDSGEIPCSLLDMVYHLLALPPFSQWMDQAVENECPQARNLSAVTRLISRFGYFLQDNHGHGKENLDDVCLFFYRYLRLWYENKVDEYEDEERYAPSGKVSFLNIHQAKGLEFPIVIVASLYDSPWDEDEYIASATEILTGRTSYEPPATWKELDFLRKYYTAFSRAETLLVLASQWPRGNKTSTYFQKAMPLLPEFDAPAIAYKEMKFRPIQTAKFKQRFSYTTRVALYEECPMKYQWSRIYQFAAISGSGMLYGNLVHETIEDIHRAVLRGEEKSLQPATIYGWMMANYDSLAKRENTWFPKETLDKAYREIMSYVAYRQDKWDRIKEAEVPLALVKDDYIIDGTIDLLQGKGNTLQLIDFKTGKKPALTDPIMERYRGQLEVYAYLVEKKLGTPVSELILYFIGSDDPLVSFPSTQERVKERIQHFDDTVHRIMAGDFNHKADHPEATCPHCAWKHYCWKK